MQKILFSQDVTYQLKLNSESKSGSSDTKLQAQIPATSCFFALIGERDKFPLLHFEVHAWEVSGHREADCNSAHGVARLGDAVGEPVVTTSQVVHEFNAGMKIESTA